MSTYAVAHVQSLTVGPEIVKYLQRIDATLAAYGGRSWVLAVIATRASWSID